MAGTSAGARATGAATGARVLVGMSGGVDSSVAALLLRDQGYDVVGVTMLLHGGPGSLEAQTNTCCSLDDVEDAREVCRELGIPHYAFDFTEPFEDAVVSDFAASYEAGRTPNPCVRCNRYLKFGALLRRARELGCDFVATGHYARVEHPAAGPAPVSAGAGGVAGGARHLLRKAADAQKDQSYFLCLLTQRQLARTLLPLGGLGKPEVRAIAARAGLVVARKRESEDICFVPDGDYLGFLERRRGAPYPGGDIVTLDGTVVGRHRGVAGYTIGQRKGLGVALGRPAYVCAKDPVRNVVTVGPADALLARACVACDWNWVAAPPDGPVRLAVRTHYRHAEQPATLTPLPAGDAGASDGADEVATAGQGTSRGTGHDVLVTFDEPQRAITPGQYAVAYDGDVLVGGGMIREVVRPA